jgi:hypothetical protein
MNDFIDNPTEDFEWDIREILVERKQPSDTITVYLSEELSYAKSVAEEALESMDTNNAEAVAVIEAELANINEQLESVKYTFHLTNVPSRMREDFSSKALAEHPQKYTNLYTDENAVPRMRAETLLLWHALITGVTNPKGQTRHVWSPKEIESLYDQMPSFAKGVINDSINSLKNRSEQHTAKSKSADFSYGN